MQAVFSRFGQMYAVTAKGEIYAWGLSSGDGSATWAASVGLPEGPKSLEKPKI